LCGIPVLQRGPCLRGHDLTPTRLRGGFGKRRSEDVQREDGAPDGQTHDRTVHRAGIWQAMFPAAMPETRQFSPAPLARAYSSGSGHRILAVRGQTGVRRGSDPGQGTGIMWREATETPAMIAFVGRRLLHAVALLLAVSLLTFALAAMTPGSLLDDLRLD